MRGVEIGLVRAVLIYVRERAPIGSAETRNDSVHPENGVSNGTVGL
jgi:hypothetical protein